MAKDNKISMPMSTAGLTRYFDDYKARLEFAPGHVVIIITLIAIAVLLLHIYGGSFFG